jgi:hypothetical protein
MNAGNKKFPNKCEYCGLRVRYNFNSARESQESDRAFGELRALHDAGIIEPIYSRNVGMTNVPDDFGTTDFCAVASGTWNKNTTKCKHWALRTEGASIADYLSIHNDRRNHAIVVTGVWIGSILAIVVGVAEVYAALRPHP